MRRAHRNDFSTRNRCASRPRARARRNLCQTESTALRRKRALAITNRAANGACPHPPQRWPSHVRPSQTTLRFDLPERWHVPHVGDRPRATTAADRTRRCYTTDSAGPRACAPLRQTFRFDLPETKPIPTWGTSPRDHRRKSPTWGTSHALRRVLSERPAPAVRRGAPASRRRSRAPGVSSPCGRDCRRRRGRCCDPR